MKKLITLLALFCVAAFAQQKGTFTDSRDGKKYKTIKIGTQTWMAENLNHNSEDAKCYDNKEENCDKYGRLYNLATAMKSCPQGWHLPSDEEWTALTNAIGGSEDSGNRLKAASGWSDRDGKSGNGSDVFGFSALPGGFSISGVKFINVGNDGSWWSSTENDSDYAYNRYIYHNGKVSKYNDNKTNLFSVRCVKDA